MPLCRKPPSLPPSCQLGSGSQHPHYGSACGCQCAFPSKVPFLPNCPPRTWISSCSPTVRHREGKPTLSQTHVAAIHTEKTTGWRRSCNKMVFGIGGSAALWLPGRGEAEHCNSNCQRLPMQTGGGCACQLHQGPQDPLLLTHPWASRRASPVGTDSSAKGCSAIHFTSVTCRPPDEPEYSVREGCLTALCYLFNKESCYRRHMPLCLSTNSDFENLGQSIGASCGSVIQGGLKPPRSLAAPFVPSYSTAGGAVPGGGYLYPAVMWDRDQRQEGEFDFAVWHKRGSQKYVSGSLRFTLTWPEKWSALCLIASRSPKHCCQQTVLIASTENTGVTGGEKGKVRERPHTFCSLTVSSCDYINMQ